MQRLFDLTVIKPVFIFEDEKFEAKRGEVLHTGPMTE